MATVRSPLPPAARDVDDLAFVHVARMSQPQRAKCIGSELCKPGATPAERANRSAYSVSLSRSAGKNTTWLS
jgi:hypothetical protein